MVSLNRQSRLSDMRLVIGSLDLEFRDFSFFKNTLLQCKNRLLERVSYFLIFVIRENEILISLIWDPQFLLGNHAMH